MVVGHNDMLGWKVSDFFNVIQCVGWAVATVLEVHSALMFMVRQSRLSVTLTDTEHEYQYDPLKC